MRVIAGTARRTTLVTPAGDGTRPTTDRIKETLFNILAPDLPQTSFLDLFAGSGGIGIEALSRGAAEAVFADHSAEAIRCVNENLRRCHLEERAKVYRGSAMSVLRRLEGAHGPFDIIFLDPPYGRGLEREVLAYLAHSGLADGRTLTIVEARAEEDVSWVSEYGYSVRRVKEYGSNKHLFLAADRTAEV
ncbi:MAG: 16S rRNA (guanine(966)-N(2))-methyltransferase RsmD [Lachnospiraceae bacterium]|nr:16S rRNA (guanine(966)-N(2))-methyltransferase RsmD [Lachnospiraceae bacterium]